jgi:hypothetical protein
MCKTAAYCSKLLEGYSLARFAYKSKYFSATEKKEEKDKKYRLIDKEVLDTINMIKTSTVPILCLIRFDFNLMKYQKLIYENPNRSLLYDEAGRPKTIEEIFIMGGENVKIKYITTNAYTDEYELVDKPSTDATPINSRESFVTRKRLLPIAIMNPHIISEVPRKLDTDYYFHRNKMSNTNKTERLDKACQTEDLKLSVSDPQMSPIISVSLQKKYVKSPFNNHICEAVTVEEYIRRGLEKIDIITDRDMNRIDRSDNDLGSYPPDSVDDFCELIELNVSDGWYSRDQELKDGERYDIAVLSVDHENPLGKLIIPCSLPFNEVIHFYDVFVAAFYNISEEYHELGEFMINRYLWKIKYRLLEKKYWNHWIIEKHLSNSSRMVHGKKKWCKLKEYIEFLNDKGQERFINFDLICRLSLLYTVTPYQMKFINSGKYEIREDLMPDLSYYDLVLNELGISKERVTGSTDYTPDSLSVMSAVGFINHPRFTDRTYKYEVEREFTEEDFQALTALDRAGL